MTKGFTLIEALLSVTIMSILVFLSVPLYQSFQVRNDLDIAGNTVAQSWRRASILSQAMDGDTTWGVRVATSTGIVIFKGTSFAVRDNTYDEFFELQSSIIPTGLQEVVFAKFTGLPQATGTLVLTTVAGEVKNIVINSKGSVDY